MLTKEQVEDFNKSGYVILRDFLSSDEISQVNSAIDDISDYQGPEFYREKDSAKIRTIFSPEEFDSRIKSVLTKNEVINVVDQLINQPFYLFQSKLNVKASLASGSWSWHQDFRFWKEDGMIAPRALTLAIMISDVSNYSGPVIAVPSSHLGGEVPCYLNNPDGVHDENLKYLISAETLRDVVYKHGPIKPFTGKAGDAVVFHSNLLHGSYQNMHFEDRKLLMFTFNPIDNITGVTNPRPNFMVKRDREVLNVKK